MHPNCRVLPEWSQRLFRRGGLGFCGLPWRRLLFSWPPAWRLVCLLGRICPPVWPRPRLFPAFVGPLAAFGGCARLFRRTARARLRAEWSARASSSTTASVERHRLRRFVAGYRGVDAVVADVGPIAAILDDDRPALVGMFAERLAGSAPKRRPFFGLAIFSAINVTARLRPTVRTSSPSSRLA